MDLKCWAKREGLDNEDGSPIFAAAGVEKMVQESMLWEAMPGLLERKSSSNPQSVRTVTDVRSI